MKPPPCRRADTWLCSSSSAAELPSQALVTAQGNTRLVFPQPAPGMARLHVTAGTAQPEQRQSRSSLARQ